VVGKPSSGPDTAPASSTSPSIPRSTSLRGALRNGIFGILVHTAGRRHWRAAAAEEVIVTLLDSRLLHDTREHLHPPQVRVTCIVMPECLRSVSASRLFGSLDSRPPRGTRE